MPVVDVGALRYEAFPLRQTDFTNGPDESSSVSSGNVGEVGTLEVGSDGQASAYEAVIVGQPAGVDPNANAAFVAMDSDDANTDVSDTVEWRLAARDKNRNRRKPLTRWYKQRDSDNSDPRQRPKITPQRPIVIDGRIVAWEVKDETASVTVDRTGSDFEVPAQGGF